MKTDIKKKRLVEFYEELSTIKKEEALDFVKWLWVRKESKFLGEKRPPNWLKKFYILFAEVRKQAGKSSSKKINLDIGKAIKEARKHA